MSGPKLKTGNVKEPYPLGKFPKDFLHSVVGQLCAAIAIGRTDIEGSDWEKIFANAIKAEWRSSFVGLDDILVPALSAAWGAKTIKSNNPFTAQKIRLISGRNSLAYSYGISDVHALDPAELGMKVVEIWNERVAALYQKYKTLRTVILVKGPELKQIAIFEKQTIRYNASEYQWSWNKNHNLIAQSAVGVTKFTWQPHGSQFTIHETIPDNALNIEINPPNIIATEKILQMISFNENCYRVISRVKA